LSSLTGKVANEASSRAMVSHDLECLLWCIVSSLPHGVDTHIARFAAASQSFGAEIMRIFERRRLATQAEAVAKKFSVNADGND